VAGGHIVLLSGIPWSRHGDLHSQPSSPKPISVMLFPLSSAETLQPVALPRRAQPAIPIAREQGTKGLAETETSSPDGRVAVERGAGPNLLPAHDARSTGLVHPNLAPTLAERAQRKLNPPARETSFENSVSRSARADCKNAYSDLGLFAVPRLLMDSIKDEGCKW
jgi:hypothetical protein